MTGDEPEHGQPAYLPERFYLLSDGGSTYFDATGGADGFETPEAAAEWARRQTTWEYGVDLDFSDGLSAIIALGADLNANAAAWDHWNREGDWPDAPGVQNHALDVPGLVIEPERKGIT